MPNGASIPPWISRIDPIAPVPMFLSGFGQGASAGTSRRVGEQQASEFAQRQALLQAQSALENELRRELAEQRAAEFTANIRLKQQEAEREAAEAAEMALDMRQYKAAVMGGMPEAQAAARYPGIFGKSRGGLGSVISAMQRAEQANQSGGFWVPPGGFATPRDVPFSFQGDPSEMVGLTGVPAHFRTGRGTVQFPSAGAQPKIGEVSEADTLRYRRLQSELGQMAREITDSMRPIPQKRLDEIKNRRETILKELAIIEGDDIPSTEPEAPLAPRDPKQRKAGTIYKAPKGIFRWTGQGWEQP